MKLTFKQTKKNPSGSKRSRPYPDLPFDYDDEAPQRHLSSSQPEISTHEKEDIPSQSHLAEAFLSQGNRLAEEGRYQEALGKWEAALTLMPENAVLHEQKAQVLLELGDAWNALKAATRATELEPSWAEAWITIGRTQLNYGEPDTALESFDRALAIKPDLEDARTDRRTALDLIKKRKQLYISGVTSVTETRYKVGDKGEIT